MTKPLKIVKIGNSAGIILTKDLLAKLNASPGDLISASATRDGVELTPHQPDFEAQMATAREVMQRRKLALRELAK